MSAWRFFHYGSRLDPRVLMLRYLGRNCTQDRGSRAVLERDSSRGGRRTRSKKCVALLGALQLHCCSVFPRAEPKLVEVMRKTDLLSRTLPSPIGRRI